MIPEFRTSGNPIDSASDYLASVLGEQLQNGKKVLWLVPGGSAILVAVNVAKKLEGIDCHNLSISLTDERYGEVGHSDSSWFQLGKAGFRVESATSYPVLNGKNVEETVSEYSNTIKNLIDKSDYSIGLFGIGADGHTAGILSMSPAVASLDYAFGYQGGNYYRITVTPSAIAMLDEVVVYAVGTEKKNTLEKLKEEHSLIDQPAQALKQVDKFIIYSAQGGSAVG